MNYLLGIDAGTTSFKGVLFDENGRQIASAKQDYGLLMPGPDLVEFDAEEYWNICCSVVKSILSKTDTDLKNIKALSISSQGETLICVDKTGKPLRNAIVWLDNRSGREADIIRDSFGIEKVYNTTGQPEIVATWPATKILWLKRNEPELAGKTHKFLLLEDYLLYRLTGRYVSEKSLLCSSLLLDIHKGRWWKEMLDFIGISTDCLPEIKDSGEVAGVLTKQACSDTGLSGGTIAVMGALDQTAGMIGAGNIKPGMVSETTGTCLAICANIDEPLLFDPKVKVTCQYHAIPNKYYLLFWCQTAGVVLRWFKDNFYRLEEQACSQSGESIFQLIDEEASKVSPGSEGLILLPHLSGAASPEYNPCAKGVFFGFTLMHTRPHFARSILEAIGYMLEKNIRILESLEVDIKAIHSLGGGAQSRLWNSIKADVTGKTVFTLKNDETACLGAAILAGVGAGVYDSIEAACMNAVEINGKAVPDPVNREIYKKAYIKYEQLYESLTGIFES